MEENGKRINGSPTKDLFIFVLTRDLSLEDAINDLIDNSIDGAKRLRTDGNYEGLFIKILVEANSFRCDDNCGGITIDIARQYAFRFGRPEGMQKTSFSIGQFGVGMKRAFFKLGKDFYVHSVALESEFTVSVSLDEWIDQKTDTGEDDWSFEFKDDYKENVKNDLEKTGTQIEVTPLHDDISKYIEETSFVENLRLNIELKHMENIFKGIDIFLNGEKLRSRRPEFRVSDLMKIAKFEKTFENGVKLELLCGIGDPTEEDGGWYIFCNDRLLLGPEQTALSGWTGGGGDGVAMYHHQFRHFRGIVYFRSEDSFKLPWNTAKNDIDASSSVFLYARAKMIELMKPVIKLLNLVKKDKEMGEDGQPKEYQPYVNMVNSTNTVSLSEITSDVTQNAFTIPIVEKRDTGEKHVTISYKKEKGLVDYLKSISGADSNKDLGELTFNYYIDQEDIEYE